MVDPRYPHTFQYTTPGTDGGYNEDTGTWDEPAPGEKVSVKCRARPNSAGRLERFQDGTMQEYNFDLGFPKGTQKIQKGVIATILGVDGELLYEGELLRYQEGVYSIRGWI